MLIFYKNDYFLKMTSKINTAKLCIIGDIVSREDNLTFDILENCLIFLNDVPQTVVFDDLVITNIPPEFNCEMNIISKTECFIEISEYDEKLSLHKSLKDIEIRFSRFPFKFHIQYLQMMMSKIFERDIIVSYDKSKYSSPSLGPTGIVGNLGHTGPTGIQGYRGAKGHLGSLGFMGSTEDNIY